MVALEEKLVTIKGENVQVQRKNERLQDTKVSMIKQLKDEIEYQYSTLAQTRQKNSDLYVEMDKLK